MDEDVYAFDEDLHWRSWRWKLASDLNNIAILIGKTWWRSLWTLCPCRWWSQSTPCMMHKCFILLNECLETLLRFPDVNSGWPADTAYDDPLDARLINPLSSLSSLSLLDLTRWIHLVWLTLNNPLSSLNLLPGGEWMIDPFLHTLLDCPVPWDFACCALWCSISPMCTIVTKLMSPVVWEGWITFLEQCHYLGTL